MSKAWQRGSTRAWRQVRAAVLLRDGHRCQIRLPGCTTIASQAHHLHGKAAGDDPAGLVAACKPCNLQVGDPSAQDPTPAGRTHW